MDKREEEMKSFDLPTIDPLAHKPVLRQRTPMGHKPEAEAEKKTKQKPWWDLVLSHPKIKPIIRNVDIWWSLKQKQYKWLAGDEYDDARYNKRVPRSCYPFLDKIERHWWPIVVTLCIAFLLMILWSIFNHMVETSVKLHFLENEANGNIRILDMSLTDVYYPTQDSAFDEWAKKKDANLEFSPTEFASASIVTTVFFHASPLFHQNDATLYNISMNDMQSVCADRCNDPNKCTCVSLFQMGVPRNAIYVYDPNAGNYRLLFDPKIKKDIHSTLEKVYWKVNENSKDKIIIEVPPQVLITYKDQHQNGKLTTRQYANEFAQCIYFQLQMRNNYTELLKYISAQQKSSDAIEEGATR